MHVLVTVCINKLKNILDIDQKSPPCPSFTIFLDISEGFNKACCICLTESCSCFTFRPFSRPPISPTVSYPARPRTLSLKTCTTKCQGAKKHALLQGAIVTIVKISKVWISSCLMFPRVQRVGAALSRRYVQSLDKRIICRVYIRCIRHVFVLGGSVSLPGSLPGQRSYLGHFSRSLDATHIASWSLPLR